MTVYSSKPERLGNQTTGHWVCHQLGQVCQHWIRPLLLEFWLNAQSHDLGLCPFHGISLHTKLRPEEKLALVSAHDSILATRVKQTRDVNKRRQVAPFKAEDLVYLSAKNISFPKGLARKLIPKFLGPYKVLRDYGNSSFQLELPPHLKRCGVHDVFHSSLLQIHIPNDDQLFPGRMVTQIVGEDAKDNEWAVDHIKSHSGTKTDTVFEIQWKSGDMTWLPYYQITHL